MSEALNLHIRQGLVLEDKSNIFEPNDIVYNLRLNSSELLICGESSKTQEHLIDR